MREKPRRSAAVQPTLLDRVVMHFNPRAGLKRIAARALLQANGQGGYDAGRREHRWLKRWRPGGGSADADTLPDLPDLRARARDLARNVPIATGALATKVTNVVGDGLQLQASIDAKALGLTDEEADAFEQEQEREWALFCTTADLTRVQHLDELAALAFRAASESGDCLVVRRYDKGPGDVYGTKLQLLEADRVSNPDRAADTPTLAGGVELDRNGAPVAYHVTDQHPGNLRTPALKWTRLPAHTPEGLRSVIHLFERVRPEQTRGVPWLAPIIEDLHKLGKYSDAEISAAVVSAMYTLIIETPADEGETPIAGETDSDLEANELKLGNAATLSLAPGEKATFANPMRPNDKFDPFVQAFLRQIGVALELPFELLIKHFTASYSASRAALEMAWQFFRRCRTWLARNFYQVVYEWMMEEAVASGRLVRPGFFADPIVRAAWCGAEWIGPSRASLNPKQEAEADALDIETGVKTREQVCMERTGGEVEKKIAQLGKERALREAAGLGAPKQLAPAGATEGGQDGSRDDDTEDESQQRGRA